jgi:hypothetical protein
VSFFRSLGGAIGVAALGAVLGNSVTTHIEQGLARLGIPSSALHGSGSTIPNTATLPRPVARVIETSYGTAVGHIFLAATPMMLLSVITILFIREVPLRTHSGTELIRSLERGGGAGEVSGGVVEHVAEATT